MKILKKIFDSFSFNEKLNKYQASKWMSEITDKEIKENDKIISDLFNDYNQTDYLNFKDFCNFYDNRIKNNIGKAWKSFYNLGYNNLLKKMRVV